MNTVEELIEKEYIKSGLFHYNDEETLKNEDGTFRKITLETNYFLGRKTIICFEYIRFFGQWSCSSTYIYNGESKGATVGERALVKQCKIIRALKKMDKDKSE